MNGSSLQISEKHLEEDDNLRVTNQDETLSILAIFF